jgi:hypothetical protein
MSIDFFVINEMVYNEPQVSLLRNIIARFCTVHVFIVTITLTLFG